VTPPVRLREPTDHDYDWLHAQQRDEVASRMAAFGTRDPDAASLAERWKRSGARTRVVMVGDEIAGSVATFEYEGKPQITYWIGRSFWGRGIATTALGLFLREITERPLYASAAFDNIGSLRVLAKCGFRVVGSEKAHAEARGVEIDEIFLRLD
jgi:RimJ/RimL family protein N-acetyltransferase